MLTTSQTSCAYLPQKLPVHARQGTAENALTHFSHRLIVGVAVTFVMFMTTIIMTIAIMVVWHHSVFVALAFFLVFGLIDVAFLSATLNKFTRGGWFPIALSSAFPPSPHADDDPHICTLQAYAPLNKRLLDI